MNPKPGYKTTEFWMTVAVHLITLLIASGIFKPGTPWAAVAALAMSALTQLQYNSGRSNLKSDIVNLMPAPSATNSDPSK